MVSRPCDPSSPASLRGPERTDFWNFYSSFRSFYSLLKKQLYARKKLQNRNPLLILEKSQKKTRVAIQNEQKLVRSGPLARLGLRDRRGREIFLKGVRSELKTRVTKSGNFYKFDENRRKCFMHAEDDLQLGGMLKTIFSWEESTPHPS